MNAYWFMPRDLPGREDLLRRVDEAVQNESQRARLILELRGKIAFGAESWIAMLLARLLRAKSTWKEHGPAIVESFIQQGEPSALWFLVMGAHESEETPEELDRRVRPLVPAIHAAFAQGLLQFLQQQGERLGPEGMKRGLTALGLLDPPRFVTKDIHRFRKMQRLDDDALNAADFIHRIASAAGGADADLNGVAQCIQELKVLVALQQGRAA